MYSAWGSLLGLSVGETETFSIFTLCFECSVVMTNGEGARDRAHSLFFGAAGEGLPVYPRGFCVIF